MAWGMSCLLSEAFSLVTAFSCGAVWGATRSRDLLKGQLLRWVSVAGAEPSALTAAVQADQVPVAEQFS